MAEAIRWEYKIATFSTGNKDKVEISLNEMGKWGWELVNFTLTDSGMVCVFKKPVWGRLPEKRSNQQESE